jgi:hypothetical protein
MVLFKLCLATVAGVARTLKIFWIKEESLIAFVHGYVFLSPNVVIDICSGTRCCTAENHTPANAIFT